LLSSLRRQPYNKDMANRPLVETARETMVFSEIVRIAVDSFRTSKVRFVLTSLGMVIGTASLILVVTIGLTGKQYVLNLIQSIGANMITAYWAGGGDASSSNGEANDFLTAADIKAVEERVAGIVAASPMAEVRTRIAVGGGKERDILVLGVAPQYAPLRNLEILAGRFFDEQDTVARAKVALVTQTFARRWFGNEDGAVGHELKVNGLPFVVIGVFRERVYTFDQTEISDDTVLIPNSVARYFTGTDAVKQLFFSVSEPGDVPAATEKIHDVLQSRHRPQSVYRVENLSTLMVVAARSANALTLVLLASSIVTLIVSGVGIMNIMLANVRSRIREIGIRKAIGATNREIRLQFLTEAVLISLAGGLVGTLLGLALPLSLRVLMEVHIPISGLSAIIAISVASLVGVIFGTVPATRAAQLDPVEALHYE
jgi:putative ABC transport system permease protein